MSSLVEVINGELTACSDFVLLVGLQETHPACENLECWYAGGNVLTGARHKRFAHVVNFRLLPKPPASSLAAGKSIVLRLSWKLAVKWVH